MLVSHRKKFIYTKTAKTAGTSIESYFEQYCMPEGEWTRSHTRDEYISEAGVIGHRGAGGENATWKGHMPAASIKNLVGDEVWNSYFKFCVVRNPFDKMVSGFTMLENRRMEGTPKTGLKAWMRKLRGKSNLGWASKPTKVERFRAWVHEGDRPTDRNKYMIDGSPCADYFIRFESLAAGVREVCEKIGVTFELGHIPTYKMGDRKDDIPVSDYYDPETEAIVRNLYDWEIERFGYQMP